MANIVIPALKEEYKVPANQPPWKIQSIATVKKVKANYGKVLEEASSYIGVPYELVVGFTSTESGGAKNETLNGGAKGIMQVEVGTAWQCLSDQLKVDTLGNFYIFYKLAPNLFSIKKTIPNPLGNASNEKASDYLKIKPLSSVSSSVAKYLTTKDAKFSAYIGSLVLGQMINKTLKSVGQIRLDHIIIKYNAGTGAFSKNVTKKGLEKSNVDTTGIYNSIKTNFAQRKSEVLRSYLVKMLGINGFLDVQKQKLA
jgi:hypothetical protein